MCHEPHLTRGALEKELETLRTAMTSGNVATIQTLLKRTVEGYSAAPHDAAEAASAKGTLH